MQVTIDKAGRLIIPKVLREKCRMSGGGFVEIIDEGESLRLRVPQDEANFKEKDGVLVLGSETTGSINSTDFINQQRANRAIDGF